MLRGSDKRLCDPPFRLLVSYMLSSKEFEDVTRTTRNSQSIEGESAIRNSLEGIDEVTKSQQKKGAMRTDGSGLVVRVPTSRG